MKVLQIGKSFPIVGGVEKVMYDLMEELSINNVSCDMLCASSNHEKKSKKIKLNEFSEIKITSTLFELAKTKISPSMIFTLRKIKNDYDIIHIHHPDPMATIAMFFSGYKGKVVLHWHSDILSQKYLLKLYKPLQTWLLKRADLILGTTPVYSQCSEDLDKYKTKIKTLPIGILDNSYQYSKEYYDKIKKEYYSKKIIFSLGRLVSYKGYEYLIKSAKYLDDSYIILIGGKGVLHNSLQELINRENLQDKVKLLGYLNDEIAYSYYKLCDIYCLSSIEKTEAFAIVQIEAMSFSKPIVATNIPGSGVPWVNSHDETGLNVEIKNPKSIALAIKSIIEDESKYQKYSEASLIRFKKEFTRNKMGVRALSIYKNLLK
jgi:glycosyltransferase involved in cell wall biosynthesis